MSEFKLYDSKNNSLSAQGYRIAIVAARFNAEIVDALLQGAIDALIRAGASEDQILVLRVPGAFEIPLICQKLADTGKFDALLALGCIIRGDTPHFDYVCSESARGVMDVGLKFSIPAINGILTVDNLMQAQQRVQKNNNKGADAANAALETLAVFAQLESIQ